MTNLWAKKLTETNDYEYRQHSHGYGIDTNYFDMIGAVYEKATLGFPMRDKKNKITGLTWIRRDRDKWYEDGSRKGCYYSTKMKSPMVLVVDGAINTVASFAMGINAIGYEDIETCGETVNSVLKQLSTKSAVIVADIFNREFKDYKKLQEQLEFDTCITVYPNNVFEHYKDGKGFVELWSVVNNLVWKKRVK